MAKRITETPRCWTREEDTLVTELWKRAPHPSLDEIVSIFAESGFRRTAAGIEKRLSVLGIRTTEAKKASSTKREDPFVRAIPHQEQAALRTAHQALVKRHLAKVFRGSAS